MTPSARPTALITGASSGIGAAYARQLAAQGYALTLVARRESLLRTLADTLAAQHSVPVRVLTADLGTPDGLATTQAAVAVLDLLVNNAGFGTLDRFDQADPARQQAMIDLHVTASVQLARAALPGMVARGRGAVINVASIAGMIPLVGGVTYSATKAYLVMFSRAVNNELWRSGVHMQALCPGYTDTDFFVASGRAEGRPRSWSTLTADEVVSASLAALPHRRAVVVPGALWKSLALLTRLAPFDPFLRRMRP